MTLVALSGFGAAIGAYLHVAYVLRVGVVFLWLATLGEVIMTVLRIFRSRSSSFPARLLPQQQRYLNSSVTRKGAVGNRPHEVKRSAPLARQRVALTTYEGRIDLMRKVGICVGALAALMLTGWIALVMLDPVLPGLAPGSVRADYERWFDVGQRVESSGMVLSVQAVREDAALARQIGVPGGSTLLFVDVSIENVRTGESLFYSPFFAVLFERSKPGKYQAELVDAAGNELHSGHLAPGEEVRGSIAFQVPLGARPSHFRYGEGIYTNSNGFPNWQPIQVRLE